MKPPLSLFGQTAADLVASSKRSEADAMHLEDAHPERAHCERSEADLRAAMDSMADYAQVHA